MMMRGKMRRRKIKERERERGNESAVREDSTFFVFVPFRVCKLSTDLLL